MHELEELIFAFPEKSQRRGIKFSAVSLRAFKRMTLTNFSQTISTISTFLLFKFLCINTSCIFTYMPCKPLDTMYLSSSMKMYYIDDITSIMHLSHD